MAQRRISFTEDEIQYIIDVTDRWVEEHTTLFVEDDEVAALHESMSTAVDVRNKLWRQLNG